jgi:ubiquinone/menaquinone biosynthesis C-methylase UbiE
VSGSAELQRQLVDACVRHLGSAASVLEWGDGAAMLHAIRRLGAGGRGVAIVADDKTYQAAQAAVSDGAGGAGRQIFFVPLAASEAAAGFAGIRDYALFPTSLKQPFSLVVVAGPAAAACVGIGWLLLDRKGVMLLRHRTGDGEAAGAIPRSAATVTIAGPPEGDTFVLLAKDAAVAEAIAADLGGSSSTSPTIRAPRNSCVFVNQYYPAFLQAHYQRHPGLASAPYAQQKASLQATFFGDSDFYSRGLQQAGWTAEDLIVNAAPLQQAWAREAGLPLTSEIDILIEQLRRIRPQVIYLQNLGYATREILARLRPLAELIVGQIACPVPPQTDVAGLDIIFTSFPHFAPRFRQAGATSYYQPLAFDARVLERLPEGPRSHALTFVGGISPEHPAGTALLTSMAAVLPIEIYGYGAESLPSESPVRAHHRGEVWGEAMFALFRSSAITVNRHIAVAEINANNMRLYEATGCGALLITDHKDNLGELFEIGKEVVAYRSAEECIALCQYYLAHPEEAQRIARAGQARTLRDHTYAQRMRDTGEILARHLRLKREASSAQELDLGSISTGHTPITAGAVTPELVSAWKDDTIPRSQRALVQRELGTMYGGGEITPFEVLAKAMRPLLSRDPSARVLEIGCASGYYLEVLRYLLGRPVDYTGVDYSPAMIAMARDYYPGGNFMVADGAQLPFSNGAFPVVVSSCVLLHVPNYRQHVAETARVAGKFVVVHRTPICRTRKTHHLRKKGYGVEMVELCYNEGELITLLAESGLSVLSSQEFHANPERDEYGVTYVCRKREWSRH